MGTHQGEAKRVRSCRPGSVALGVSSPPPSSKAQAPRPSRETFAPRAPPLEIPGDEHGSRKEHLCKAWLSYVNLPFVLFFLGGERVGLKPSFHISGANHALVRKGVLLPLIWFGVAEPCLLAVKDKHFLLVGQALFSSGGKLSK